MGFKQPAYAPTLAQQMAYPLVPALDPASVNRRLFDDSEQVFAGYLLIVAPLANDIVVDGSSLHGWMAGGWWRTPIQPYNARIQEHVATLSWFFKNVRPWNPYSGDAALLARLVAATDYYLGIQNSDGSWPENKPGEHSRAATGFGLVALTETLANLRSTSAPSDLISRIKAALVKAAVWFLEPTNTEAWSNPIVNCNQTVAGLSGCARLAEVTGDSTLMSRVNLGIEAIATRSQASGGWFFEPRGFDFGYNWDVMLPDLGELYRITRNPKLVSMATKWADFFSFASVRETSANGFIYHAAATARNASNGQLPDVVPNMSNKAALSSVFVPSVPVLAAFKTTDVDESLIRAAWRSSTNSVAPLRKLDTSPRLWMYSRKAPLGPTPQAKASAIAKLPYLERTYFNEVRNGVLDMQFLFTRRPAFYVCSLFGKPASGLVKNGPQLVWSPDVGVFVLGMNTGTSTDGFWTSQLADGRTDATTTMAPSYYSGAKVVGDPIPSTSLKSRKGDLTVAYGSNTTPITSSVTFAPYLIKKTVASPEKATEVIPLLLQPGDQLMLGDIATAWGTSCSAIASSFRMVRKGRTITFRWKENLPVGITPVPTRKVFADGRRMQHLLRISHAGVFELEISTDY